MRQRKIVKVIAILVIAGGVAAVEYYCAKLGYASTYGKVTYDHRIHTIRQKFACWTCHTTPFPFWKGPLTYAGILHKAAEADKTSCGLCHRPGGEAFETRGNCKKCHEKPVVDPGAAFGPQGTSS